MKFIHKIILKSSLLIFHLERFARQHKEHKHTFFIPPLSCFQLISPCKRTETVKRYGGFNGKTICVNGVTFTTTFVALRELGRIERTLFTLDWLQNVELRRRVQVGLNKGESKNALARAVFFNRLGELRDRSFENQRYRASGLNLVVAAIVPWNTVYLERSIQALRARERSIDDILAMCNSSVSIF